MDQDMNQPNREHKNNIGAKLRYRREALSLTLEEVAQRVGISAGYLSEVERGKTAPAVVTLKNLAEVLDLRLPILFKEGGSDLAIKLRQSRTSLGLSQAQLAREAGISVSMVAELEAGRAQPSLRTLEKVAAVLGVSPCYLILEHPEIEDMLVTMGHDVRDLFSRPEVLETLKLICDLPVEDVQFILEFISLYRRRRQ